MMFLPDLLYFESASHEDGANLRKLRRCDSSAVANSRTNPRLSLFADQSSGVILSQTKIKMPDFQKFLSGTSDISTSLLRTHAHIKRHHTPTHLTPAAMVRVAINGFGRIGRCLFRFLWEMPDVEIVLVNEIVGGAETAGYLLKYDSIHGCWEREVDFEDASDSFSVDGKPVAVTVNTNIADTDWASHGVDLVCCCTGKFLTKEKLQPYFDGGVKRVVVSAPVKEEGVLNVVMGCNDDLLADEHTICTAASCTTNCLAPVVKVIHEKLGIAHGCITTIHNVTGTQPIIDMAMTKKKDLRRCRSGMLNLAPTSTGSATAIATIFPELKGKLNGLAIRVPMLNASITDCVFEVKRETTGAEVNELLKSASEDGPLKGIMGYETRPLVSTDYTNDERSGIVDARSTMVVDGTCVKIYAWYDNEWGYSKRMAELTCKVARTFFS